MSHDTKGKEKKKKDSSFYLHETTWGLGRGGWTGPDRASCSGAGSSLSILKTSLGAPGMQLPQRRVQDYTGADLVESTRSS